MKFVTTLGNWKIEDVVEEETYDKLTQRFKEHLAMLGKAILPKGKNGKKRGFDAWEDQKLALNEEIKKKGLTVELKG